MTHCPYYECLMNGSNLVTEADKKPFALCPICLRKMSVYLKLSNEMIHGRYLSVISSVEGYNNPMFQRELTMFYDITNKLKEKEIMSDVMLV